MRRLDRYVFSQFLRLFAVMTLGFPVLLVITDLAQRLEEYLNRNIPARDLALSYVYWMPDSLFMVVPAAVLMATVFTITSLTRHAELTAAKASGVSFFRLVAPVFVGATLALGLDVGLGALAPSGNQRRSELLRENLVGSGTTRYNFVFAGEYGRVYKALELRTDLGSHSPIADRAKGCGRFISDLPRQRRFGGLQPSLAQLGARARRDSSHRGQRTRLRGVVRGGARATFHRAAERDDDEATAAS